MEIGHATSKEASDQFGYITYNPPKHTEYPIIRLCALMSLRSRMIRDVKFSSSRIGEISYAKQLVHSAPAYYLTILDRCYLSAELIVNWQRANEQQHWLTPIKSNTKYQIIERYADKDFLVEMNVSDHARKKDPSLPDTWRARHVTYDEKNRRIISQVYYAH